MTESRVCLRAVAVLVLALLASCAPEQGDGPGESALGEVSESLVRPQVAHHDRISRI